MYGEQCVFERYLEEQFEAMQTESRRRGRKVRCAVREDVYVVLQSG